MVTSVQLLIFEGRISDDVDESAIEVIHVIRCFFGVAHVLHSYICIDRYINLNYDEMKFIILN